MRERNPFYYKDVEKELRSTFKDRLPPGRRTRSYLRRQARNIEHAYEIGHRDGLAGKALIPLEELQKGDDSPLAALMMQRAYLAYCTGYRCGTLERKEVV